jgi:hypothetical protein
MRVIAAEYIGRAVALEHAAVISALSPTEPHQLQPDASDADKR